MPAKPARKSDSQPGGSRKAKRARGKNSHRTLEVENEEIAGVFDHTADLLEILAQNPFRVRAYRNAARLLRALPDPVRDRLAAGQDLTELPGIGADLAGKIAEVVRTGRLALLAELSRKVAPGTAELLELRGLGPKRVRLLHDQLGISTLAALERALRTGRLAGVRGFGPKIVQNLRASVEHRRTEGARVPWALAEPVVRAVVEHMRSVAGLVEIEAAGSFRRRKETVGDLDFVVASEAPGAVIERFAAFPAVTRVLARGTTRATVLLRTGLQLDLRVVPVASFGAALVYLTGSKAHNIALRRLGIERDLKVNEYGVFRGAKRVAGRTERDVYAALGLPYVEPELRESHDELEAAREQRLPRLVELGDLRGDLHVHTSATDGRNTIEEMARAARERGHEYIAITDHTQSTRVAHGLDAARLERHLSEIDRAGRRVKGIRLLRSAEVDIREDGSLDLPANLLSELDLVVAAIHSRFTLPKGRQTDRVVAALSSGRVHVLAHPTGRLLGERPKMDIDIERVIAAASRYGTALELNAQPLRLDLDDIACRAARAAGVPVVISSDAHSTEELDFLRYGIGTARRGWLERRDVLNTRSWKEIVARRG